MTTSPNTRYPIRELKILFLNINNKAMKKNILQQNPNLSGSLFLSVLALLLLFVGIPFLIIIILIVFSIRQIRKAKQNNENKKFIIVSYVLVSIPLILGIVLYILNLVFFVSTQLNEARGM